MNIISIQQELAAVGHLNKWLFDSDGSCGSVIQVEQELTSKLVDWRKRPHILSLFNAVMENEDDDMRLVTASKIDAENARLEAELCDLTMSACMNEHAMDSPAPSSSFTVTSLPPLAFQISNTTTPAPPAKSPLPPLGMRGGPCWAAFWSCWANRLNASGPLMVVYVRTGRGTTSTGA